MPGINDMGIENVKQGICGFTSALYAVYMNRPSLQKRLEGALKAEIRSTRLMAEIKTFLQMMKADGNNAVLNEITELTKSFPGYGKWNVDSYIKGINELQPKYSIAMPPKATMEYMRTAWEMRPFLTDKEQSGDVILGLTRSGAPKNRWKNLAHYVYQDTSGKIYSWGDQFKDLPEMNTKKSKDYSVIYRIMVNG